MPRQNLSSLENTTLQLALQTAAKWHEGHRRKGDGIPYVAHLLNVGSLALQEGAAMETVAAALLHDSIEDVGATPGEIEALFGTKAARTVEMCSDSNTSSSVESSYRARKIAHVVKLQRFFHHPTDQVEQTDLRRSVLVVLAADKYDNMLSMSRAAARQGEAFWQCLTGGAFGMMWYYRMLAPLFDELGDLNDSPLRWGLMDALEQLESMAASYTFDNESALQCSRHLAGRIAQAQLLDIQVWPDGWDLEDELHLCVTEALRRAREQNLGAQSAETVSLIEDTARSWYSLTASEVRTFGKALRG